MTLPTSLAAALADQATSCGSLGSPLMARLFRLMADGWVPEGALAERIVNWPDGSSGYQPAKWTFTGAGSTGRRRRGA